MQILEIEPTYSTPKVIFDPLKKHFLISGSSILEEVDNFYTPLLEWMDDFLQNINPRKLEFTFEINYLNASSGKMILHLMQKLKKIEAGGGEIRINWVYCKHDLNILEVGEDFSSMLQLHFKFIDQSECCHSLNHLPFSVN